MFFRTITVILSFFIFLLPASVNGQTVPPSRLVDAPTAGLLPGKTLQLETHLSDGGGVVQSINFGVTDLIDIGCSYGGAGIIGAGKVTWQPHAAFQVRVRIMEETLNSPAIAVGFDSQGYGPYVRRDKLNRFRNKSRGAFIVMSRNYSLMGDLGLHAGVNYSLETDDGDEDPSFWAGIDKNIGRSLEICGEYDFATNDNEDSSMTANRGYLNGAVRWRFDGGFVLELDVKNILRNAKKDIAGMLTERPEPSRELRFSYQKSF